MTFPGPSPVTVTIVDDAPYVRAALEALFAAVDEVTVIASLTSGEDAVAAPSLGDVVLMDVRMPGLGGIAATEILTSRASPPRVRRRDDPRPCRHPTTGRNGRRQCPTVQGGAATTVTAHRPGTGDRSLPQRGLSDAEIADRLFISVPTVKTHVSTIFRKLGADSRLQIALPVRDAELPCHSPRLSPPER
ncbi:response regulator transcription factor [uncultured Corynebacterium sp.]|uniref:response regulator transcription factor n=1 Tax=uncultured Corynebacterium sp. TaxID=159447 RepID=UPI0025DA8204|nr:response regulator transcription factor [uncultured Corynebacterium sp.]